MHIIANMQLCQGHGRCEQLCPAVFSTDPVEGKVLLTQTKVPSDLEPDVRLAIRNCPEGALRLSRRTQ